MSAESHSGDLFGLHVMSARELALRQAEHGLFPVDATLASFLPRGGLQRSMVYQCAGPASMSLVWALVAAATQHGSWLCLVDMPNAGLLAAREYGVALERVVQVDTANDRPAWVRTVGALIDGIDIVVVRRPRCQPSESRKLSARAKAQSCVLIVIDPPEHFPCDVVLRTTDSNWVLDGHARERRVSVVLGGRRVHNAQRQSILLPSSRGRADSSAISCGDGCADSLTDEHVGSAGNAH